VLDLAVSADNARFVSVGGDKTVFLWDVATARTLRRYGGHAGRVMCCAFGGEGDAVVVSGGYDASVRVWDTRSQGYKPLMVLAEAKDTVADVVVKEVGIVSASFDGRVREYDLRMGTVVTDVQATSVTSLCAARDGGSLLVGTLDSTVRLIDRGDGRCLKSYRAPDLGFVNENYRIRSTLGLNDSVVISGSEDGQILVWDLLEGSVMHALSHAEIGSMGSGGGKSAKKDVVSAVAWCTGSKKEWCSAGGDGTFN